MDTLSSLDVLTVNAACKDPYSDFIYADLYDEAGNFLMRQTELYVVPKFFAWKKPNLSVEVKKEDGNTVITLTSDTLAKGVFLDFADCDPALSSNFFDLVSGEPYKVAVTSDRTPEELKRSLQIKTVYDIGR